MLLLLWNLVSLVLSRLDFNVFPSHLSAHLRLYLSQQLLRFVSKLEACLPACAHLHLPLSCLDLDLAWIIAIAAVATVVGAHRVPSFKLHASLGNFTNCTENAK